MQYTIVLAIGPIGIGWFVISNQSYRPWSIKV
jgi:hypothetical protein